MIKRIFTEAAGSMVSSYMIKAIKEAGHISVASDITLECSAAVLADELVQMPFKNDPQLWQKVERILIDHQIDIVIPSFDEMLLGWAQRKEIFDALGIKVLISDFETVQLFQDKWLTYKFFNEYDIPCAKTSLVAKYPLVKPREGRGGSGIFIEYDSDLRLERFQEGDISQEVLKGEEYTVDCLFDSEGHAIYIVPRKRIGVINGKSTSGIVEMNPTIISAIKRISSHVKFFGPINIQCFIDYSQPEIGQIHFVEVNARIAGGMALGFAATENWIPLFISLFEGKTIKPKEVKNGLKMYRTYQELFTL